ncbi:MAG: tRNA (adenosine(37)-N6)-threonylcarbamoyltransferase complex transferase subunit TsaD [Candidatus Nomurabacteria bacterium]|nr:tRNA (adenosine(37)-N6)-threonylcarbamoyltransferase complex transferase subunit TsaD [Candidatus Nomurabacteria bacterium]
MKVLGIETSCDETAAAVVEDGRRILSNVVVSQIDIHRAFGGVVPEVAARSHIEAILPVIEEALVQAKSGDPDRAVRVASRRGSPEQCFLSSEKFSGEELMSGPEHPEDELDFADVIPEGSLDFASLWDSIDAIAVSTCPGLIGSLMIGVQTAKTLALLKNKPLFPVHHVEAHVYANFLTESPAGHSVSPERHSGLDPESRDTFPILALIVSGGHSQIVLFRDHGDYQILGATRDDAVGEAFDKVAKIIGLPYPGGPSIAAAATKGNPKKYHLPKPKLDNPYEFSFSGLKTAVLRAVQSECGKDYTFPSNALSGLLNDAQRQDFAASFQNTAVEILVEAVCQAQAEFQPKSVVIAGGVAANQELRRQLSAALPVEIAYAPPELCTDNAAMVASLGYFKSQKTAPANLHQIKITPSISMAETGWAKA